MRWSTLSLGLMFGLGASPALASPDALLALYGRDADYVAARDAIVRDGPADPALDAAMQHADWRVRVTAGAILRWRADPAAAAGAWTATPGRTRAGLPRFAEPALSVPENTPVLLERLLHGDDPSSTRVALAEWIPRAGGDWAPAFVALLDEERDPAVRAVLADGLRRAPAPIGLAGARVALADPDPGVRLAALGLVGRLNDPALDAELLAALTSPEAEVRAEAAFVTGALGRAQGWTPVVGLLCDPSAEVRLAALGALRRLDAERARALTELGPLSADPDPRVARLAAQMRQGE